MDVLILEQKQLALNRHASKINPSAMDYSAKFANGMLAPTGRIFLEFRTLETTRRLRSTKASTGAR